MTTRIASQAATGRQWAGLAVLALPTLLLSVDIFVLLLALPEIDKDFRASNTQQLWISDSCGFLLAGFLVTMGTLGDRIGRRTLLRFALGIAILGSVALHGVAVIRAALLAVTTPGVLMLLRHVAPYRPATPDNLQDPARAPGAVVRSG